MNRPLSPFPLSKLTSDRFLREVRHFLWLEGHVNNGKYDAGWNCRDHGWLTAFLVKAAGLEPAMLHGEAAFVLRKTASTSGILFLQDPHSWAGTVDLGIIDLSTRAEGEVGGEQFRMPIACIYGNKWLPKGRGS